MSVNLNMRYQALKWRAWTLLALGRMRSADRVFEQMSVEFSTDAYVLASRAQRWTDSGEIEKAIEAFRELLAHHPGDVAGWFNLGFLLESSGDDGQAEVCFRRAIELDPKLDRAWYGLSLVLIRLQRFDQAIVALKRNIELQPMSPYGWYQMARVHADCSQFDKAVEIIRHLRGFEPKVAAQLEREIGSLMHQGVSDQHVVQ